MASYYENCSCTFSVTAHHKPEQVTLSVIIKSRVIYRSYFLYTAAPEHYIAELLVQSVSGTPQLDALLSFVPSLKTSADLAAFDSKLTSTFSAIALPRDWTLVGYKNLKSEHMLNNASLCVVCLCINLWMKRQKLLYLNGM